MTQSNGSGDGTDAVRVEVIDDCGRVLEAVYVSEITGVRALSDEALRQVRGAGAVRDR